MTDQEYIKLAKQPRSYIRLGLLVASLVSLIPYLLAGALVTVAVFFAEYPEPVPTLGAKIAFAVVFDVFMFIVPIGLFIGFIVLSISLANKTKLLEEGKKKYERKLQNDELRKQRQIEKEAKQKEEAERKAEIARVEEINRTPDIKVDKEFTSKLTNSLSKAWISIEERLIQFYVPLTGKENTFLETLFFGQTKMIKTKALKIDDIADMQLVDITEQVESVHGLALGTSYSNVGVGTVSGSKKITTNHFYRIEFKFNDIDCPVVYVYYDSDKLSADTLYQTIEILRKK